MQAELASLKEYLANGDEHSVSVRSKTTNDLAELSRKLGEKINKTMLEMEELTAAKAEAKTAIKNWAKAFRAENGRVPTTEDKQTQKPLFVKYKKVCIEFSAYFSLPVAADDLL